MEKLIKFLNKNKIPFDVIDEEKIKLFNGEIVSKNYSSYYVYMNSYYSFKETSSIIKQKFNFYNKKKWTPAKIIGYENFSVCNYSNPIIKGNRFEACVLAYVRLYTGFNFILVRKKKKYVSYYNIKRKVYEIEIENILKVFEECKKLLKIQDKKEFLKMKEMYILNKI